MINGGTVTITWIFLEELIKNRINAHSYRDIYAYKMEHCPMF